MKAAASARAKKPSQVESRRVRLWVSFSLERSTVSTSARVASITTRELRERRTRVVTPRSFTSLSHLPPQTVSPPGRRDGRGRLWRDVPCHARLSRPSLRPGPERIPSTDSALFPASYVLPRLPAPRFARSSPRAARSARPKRSDGPERMPSSLRCSLALSGDLPRVAGSTPRTASRTARWASLRRTRPPGHSRRSSSRNQRAASSGVALAPERSPRRRAAVLRQNSVRRPARGARPARSPISSRTPRRGSFASRRRVAREAAWEAETDGRPVRRLGPSRRSSFGRTFARAPRGERAARRARLRPIPSVRLNASTTRPAGERTTACAREGEVEGE